jgi:hypothetical protein
VVDGTELICPGYVLNITNNAGDHQIYTFDPTHARASCVPYGDSTGAAGKNGGYLLYPFVTNVQDSDFGFLFSTCSETNMQHTVKKQGFCLLKPDPCSAGGSCCGDTGLEIQGTECRAADPTIACSAAAACDGVHAYCPANEAVVDGTPCDQDATDLDNHGVCHSGTCSHIHAQWCFDNSGALPSCSVPGMSPAPPYNSWRTFVYIHLHVLSFSQSSADTARHMCVACGDLSNNIAKRILYDY